MKNVLFHDSLFCLSVYPSLLPAVAENVRLLKTGTDLMKVKKSKLFPRLYFLEEDLSGVAWKSNHKKPNKARSESCSNGDEELGHVPVYVDHTHVLYEGSCWVFDILGYIGQIVIGYSPVSKFIHTIKRVTNREIG